MVARAHLRTRNVPGRHERNRIVQRFASMSPHERIDFWDRYLAKLQLAVSGDEFEMVGEFIYLTVEELLTSQTILTADEQDFLVDTLERTLDTADTSHFHRASDFVYSKTVWRLGEVGRLCPTKIDELVQIMDDVSREGDQLSLERLVMGLPDMAIAIHAQGGSSRDLRMGRVRGIYVTLMDEAVDFARKKLAISMGITLRSVPGEAEFLRKNLELLTKDDSQFVRKEATNSLSFLPAKQRDIR